VDTTKTPDDIEKEMESADTSESPESAREHYSDEKFWEKVKKYGKKAGSSLVYMVLLLYFTLQKPGVPVAAKAIIIGALGYFILPLDFIPDLTPGVGYTDDLGALGAALFQVAIYIDQDVKDKAKAKLSDWFGDNVDTSDIDTKL
jgi:uncharacterized membrane protein YkvA (DUF1232 family)